MIGTSEEVCVGKSTFQIQPKNYVYDLCDIDELALFLFVFLSTGTYFSLITLLGVEHMKYVDTMSFHVHGQGYLGLLYLLIRCS